MTALNWVLGILTLLFWGGAALWYFRKIIQQAWVQRNDKWFRD